MTLHTKPGAPVIQAIDSRSFRNAMSRMASSVTIVTTDGPAGRAGFTATAVASVSDNPATLLFCLNRSSRSHRPLEENGVFCVNLLTEAMADLAEVFAGRNIAPDADTVDHRFAQAEWRTLATGSPVLQGGLVAFDCRIAHIVPVATHDVVIGEVEALSPDAEGGSLVYAGRDFHAVTGPRR